ncbi:MAG: hypothetical protein MRJ67_11645 [Nitrospirales bacterium]|nr:hypothetical protein [Nitrospirales bacterium]
MDSGSGVNALFFRCNTFAMIDQENGQLLILKRPAAGYGLTRLGWCGGTLDYEDNPVRRAGDIN